MIGCFRPVLASGVTLIALAALACTEVKDDPNACQQGYGFGSYGCAEVTGSVLNTTNLAIANVNISAGTATDPFDLAQTSTDGIGKFRLRLERRWLAQNKSSDTASAWVHAKFPAPPTPATARDSVFVLLTFSPIRQRPVATVVTMHLP